jgi:hypothetical protein
MVSVAPGREPWEPWDPPAVSWALGIPPLSRIGRSPPSLTALDSANTITHMPNYLNCSYDRILTVLEPSLVVNVKIIPILIGSLPL